MTENADPGSGRKHEESATADAWLDFEREVWEWEKDRKVEPKPLWERHFPSILTAAITFLGLVVSGAQIGVAFINKAKEIKQAELAKEAEIERAERENLRDIEYRYTELIVENRDLIFEGDPEEVRRFRDAILVSTSSQFVRKVFGNLSIVAPEKQRKIWEEGLAYSSNTAEATPNLTPVPGGEISGHVATFGGPNDASASPNEHLALVETEDDKFQSLQEYFLDPARGALVRNLNPEKFYIACRWNYNETSRDFLQSHRVTVTNLRTGESRKAQPIDWGPSGFSGRIADLSPGLVKELGLRTDDKVTISIPNANMAN